MKVIVKLNKQKIIKSLKYITIFLITLYTLLAIYSFTFEQDKIAIDRYNFGQLEKVKLVLKNIPEKDMHFYDFNDFNETYNTNITPIKNCYVLSYRNGKNPYIFGFQLESLIYRFIYFGKKYAYPSYSRPIEQYCFGEHSNGAVGGCYDSDKQPFIDKISNPCE